MNRVLLVVSFYLLVSCISCKQDDLFERLEPVHGGQWKSSFAPSFTFLISDTTAAYNVYVTVRHTNDYAYNNIWLQSSLQLPADTLLTQNFPRSGPVTFTLKQIMRRDPLPGILQVGMRVEKAN